MNRTSDKNTKKYLRNYKIPGLKSSRTVRTVRNKVQKEIDLDVKEIEERLAEFRSQLGMEGDGVPVPMGTIPAPVEGHMYFIKDDENCGIFILKQIITKEKTLYLFENIITNIKTTYTLYSLINDIKEFREVTSEDADSFKKNYFRHVAGFYEIPWGKKKGVK